MHVREWGYKMKLWQDKYFSYILTFIIVETFGDGWILLIKIRTYYKK